MTGTCTRPNGRGDTCGLPYGHRGPCGWQDRGRIESDKRQDERRRREAAKPNGKNQP